MGRINLIGHLYMEWTGMRWWIDWVDEKGISRPLRYFSNQHAAIKFAVEKAIKYGDMESNGWAQNTEKIVSQLVAKANTPEAKEALNEGAMFTPEEWERKCWRFNALDDAKKLVEEIVEKCEGPFLQRPRRTLKTIGMKAEEWLRRWYKEE